VESAATSTVVDGGDGPVARTRALVTPGLFQMLGVRPVTGRLFSPDEGRAGTDDVVLISAVMWNSVFGADPGL
jgi:hypothetical protein